MKKSIVALLLIAFLSSSCSSYYCPTYSKAPVKEKKEIGKVESERV